jgi:hypothetical protein
MRVPRAVAINATRIPCTRRTGETSYLRNGELAPGMTFGLRTACTARHGRKVHMEVDDSNVPECPPALRPRCWPSGHSV